MVRPKEKLPSEHIVLHDQRRAPRRTGDTRVPNASRALETTLLISQALSPHSTLEELIVQTLDTALKAVNAEGGSILIADASSQQLINYRSVGEKPVPPGTAVQRKYWT